MSADGSLSAGEAAALLARLEHLHASLARRTAGLMWMVWGLVAPAIFLTYWLATVQRGAEGPAWWFALLWMPWAACGIVTTWALWRSAALALPLQGVEGGARTAAHVALFAGASLGSVAVVVLMGLRVPIPGAVLAALGAASLALGLSGIAVSGEHDRRLRLAVGALLIGASLAASIASAGWPLDQAYGFSALAGALASGLAFFGSGAFLATRG